MNSLTGESMGNMGNKIKYMRIARTPELPLRYPALTQQLSQAKRASDARSWPTQRTTACCPGSGLFEPIRCPYSGSAEPACCRGSSRSCPSNHRADHVPDKCLRPCRSFRLVSVPYVQLPRLGAGPFPCAENMVLLSRISSTYR